MSPLPGSETFAHLHCCSELGRLLLMLKSKHANFGLEMAFKIEADVAESAVVLPGVYLRLYELLKTTMASEDSQMYFQSAGLTRSARAPSL